MTIKSGKLKRQKEYKRKLGRIEKIIQQISVKHGKGLI